jgi:membrane fusion protein, copper/silver efflux system
MKILHNKYLVYGLILAAGILLGRTLFHSGPAVVEKHDHALESTSTAIWTCSMHPQIRMTAPGKCPICAMDLIPVSQNGRADIDPDGIQLPEEALQLANVLTSVVAGGNGQTEIRLYGKVQADERLLQNQVAHIPGRIEKLLVNYTGEAVNKGQKLAEIYSPDLVTAQQELLETVKTKGSMPTLYEAAREKLRQWKLTETQISEIENSGAIRQVVEVESNTSGIVTEKRINTGDYVSQGSVLFEISDLSRVWVLFDAYESDLPFIKTGDKIDFTIQALPDIRFSGVIKFIDPVIDQVNRVARVRIETGNPGARLKPGMFVTGTVKSDAGHFRDKLVIPRSAILWTGKRSIVYVKQPGSGEPVFKIREIVLGSRLGDSYLVNGGLSGGEEIVTQGAFSIDAAAQLEGKPSMMNSNQGNNTSQNDTGVTDPDQVINISIKVAGACDMCKERIENAAKSVKGVRNAEWTAAEQALRLSFISGITSSDAVQKVIAGVGHDTEKYKAPDDVYNKLPECCLYKRFIY